MKTTWSPESIPRVSSKERSKNRSSTISRLPRHLPYRHRHPDDTWCCQRANHGGNRCERGGKNRGKATFTIALSDHNIDRPKILWEKLAETVNVTTTFTYEPYKK